MAVNYEGKSFIEQAGAPSLSLSITTPSSYLINAIFKLLQLYSHNLHLKDWSQKILNDYFMRVSILVMLTSCLASIQKENIFILLC